MSKRPVDLNERFRNKLRDEFTRRMRNNERYSLRSFARQLQVDPSTISQILKGKRRLSVGKIEQLCLKAGFDFDSLEDRDYAFKTIDADTFSMIADWYHFAILDLSLINDFNSDSKWIARRLGITEVEAKAAISRLLRFGFLIEENGKLKKHQPFYTNDAKIKTSAAHQEYQRQVIKKALSAVDEVPQELKDITSITIAADTRKLNQARKMIKKFRRSVCELLEDGSADSVYHFTLQLYPVSQE